MKSNHIQKPLALRAQEAAKVLNISERTLWQLTKEGIIPHVKFGSGKRTMKRYPVSVLEEWLSQQIINKLEAKAQNANDSGT